VFVRFFFLGGESGGKEQICGGVAAHCWAPAATFVAGSPRVLQQRATYVKLYRPLNDELRVALMLKMGSASERSTILTLMLRLHVKSPISVFCVTKVGVGSSHFTVYDFPANSATVAVVSPFSATVALFCDSVDRALASR